MDTDFSFNNQNIKRYFDGDDSYLPERELLYLHTHPLIQPNFLSQIENMVQKSGELLLSRNVKEGSHWITELETLCIRIGKTMPDLSLSNPKETLTHLRELYILCNKILKV